MEAVAQTNLSSEIIIDNLPEANYFLFALGSFFCIVFLLINITILSTIRSKPIFCDCPRYVLLFNLVTADTILMAGAQVMSVLSVVEVRLLYPLCGFLIMLMHTFTEISPLTLSVMSLERCVSVCFPFRHSTIVTMTHTGVAIAMIWTCSVVDVVFRAVLMLEFPFRDLPSLQMKWYCTVDMMRMGPRSEVYDWASTAVLFAFSGLITLCSFLAVLVVARSASSDTSSAVKSRNTLLLHLFQLGLNLLAAMNVPIYLAPYKALSRYVAAKVAKVLYIFVTLAPRCLSTLTYGLNDHRLRPELVSRLCCCLRITTGSVRVQVTSLQTVKLNPHLSING